jgi:hypothetical protein
MGLAVAGPFFCCTIVIASACGGTARWELAGCSRDHCKSLPVQVQIPPDAWAWIPAAAWVPLPAEVRMSIPAEAPVSILADALPWMPAQARGWIR